MPAAGDVTEVYANRFNASQQTYTASSVAVPANTLVLLLVSPNQDQSGVVEPTISDTSLETWTKAGGASYKVDDHGAYAFHAVFDSGQTVDISADFGAGNDQDSCGLHVLTVASTPTTGTSGAAAIMQAVFKSGNDASPNVDLSAFDDATNNLALAFVTQRGIAGAQFTAESGYTAGTETGTGGAGIRTHALPEWKQGEDTSISAGSDQSGDWGVIGLEIADGGVDTSPPEDEVDSPGGAKSDYAERATLDWQYPDGTTNPERPTGLELALYEDDDSGSAPGNEASFAGYARQTLSVDAAASPEGDVTSKSNDAGVTFSNTGGSVSPDLFYFGVWATFASGPDQFWSLSDRFASPVSIAASGSFTFQAGEIVLQES